MLIFLVILGSFIPVRPEERIRLLKTDGEEKNITQEYYIQSNVHKHIRCSVYLGTTPTCARTYSLVNEEPYRVEDSGFSASSQWASDHCRPFDARNMGANHNAWCARKNTTYCMVNGVCYKITTN